jgi:predicted Holliday junction resolvase-like endonuclease
MFLLCREGITSDAMDMFHQHAMLLNKFTVSQILLLDPVVSALRKEFRKVFPDIKVDVNQLTEMLKSQILKREVIEGEKAIEAAAKIKKVIQKAARTAAKNDAKAESKDTDRTVPTETEPEENSEAES